MISRTLVVAALSLAVVSAFAQAPAAAASTQRDVAQQTRIENGLKDGSLSTREAGRLEKQQARIDRLQTRDLKDGKLTVAERAQLNAAQDKASRDIAADKHNAVTGNPDSASSKRLQADVARNAAQEKRITTGLQSGALTKPEAAKLERGQAAVDNKEAVAASNGHVSRAEQRSVQRAETRQSKRIHREKTDAQTRG